MNNNDACSLYRACSQHEQQWRHGGTQTLHIRCAEELFPAMITLHPMHVAVSWNAEWVFCLLSAIVRCDSHCQIWQPLSDATDIFRCDSQCQMWQPLSDVTVSVRRDRHCQTWQTVSDVTVSVRCDCHCQMWQSVSDVTVSVRCGRLCQKWQSVSDVTVSVRCDSQCQMWQTLSDVTSVVSCDSQCQIWQTLSDVTACIKCDKKRLTLQSSAKWCCPFAWMRGRTMTQAVVCTTLKVCLYIRESGGGNTKVKH